MRTIQYNCRTLVPALALACLSLCLCGCVEFEQRLLILPDGSGEIAFTYSVEESQLNTLTHAQAAVESLQGRGQQAQNRTAAQLQWMFNTEVARQFFSGDGIKLERYLVFTRGERKVVQVLCAVKNMRQALATGRFGDFTLTRNADGNWVLGMELPEGPEKVSDERVAQLKTLCKGLKLKLVIQTPTAITAKLGGGKAEDQRVEWDFDLDKDDTFLRSMRPIQVVFDGQKLNWADDQPPKPQAPPSP